jgi:hypothetical protein
LIYFVINKVDQDGAQSVGNSLINPGSTSMIYLLMFLDMENITSCVMTHWLLEERVHDVCHTALPIKEFERLNNEATKI